MDESIKVNALEQPHLSQHAPASANWEPESVGRALIAAFATLDRMPRMRGPRAPGGNWPRHAVEWADQLAQAELDETEKEARAIQRNRTFMRPSAADIAAMDAAFEWLRELRRLDSGLALVTSLWALYSARNRSIRRLCVDRQWAPHMFYRKRAKALEHLAQWLNERAVPLF